MLACGSTPLSVPKPTPGDGNEITRFYQQVVITKTLVPCYAFWSAQSITRTRLTFCWDWTNLLTNVFQAMKLAVIGPAQGTVESHLFP